MIASRNNRVKLIDFGVSRILHGTGDKALTVIGTPENMAPELLQGKPYSYKSDIWQLGVLLFKMCTLEQPWNCETMEDQRDAVLYCKYPNLPSSFSISMKNLLTSCLQKRPHARADIKGLLNMPIINKRIRSYLQDSEY